MKRVLSIALSVLLACLIMPVSMAEDYYASEITDDYFDENLTGDYSSYYGSQAVLLTDDANLLTASEETALNNKLNEISENQEFIVAIATVDTMGGKSVVAFSDDLFEERFGTTADGVILVVCMSTRDWYISTQGYGITAITDYCIGYMEDAFVSDLSDGEYYKAFNKYANICNDCVTQAKTGVPYDTNNRMKRIKSPFDFLKSLVISLVIGIIIAFVIVGTMKGQLKTVKMRNDATDYTKQGSLNVTNSNEFFLYNTVSRTRRVEESSRSGGGGSSTHTSSSGTSHGGGGGKF